jgi:diguanylate cyclase (GGDEF)-like protein
MILLYDETQVFNLLRELNRLSNYDTMTGLNNRNYIESRLESLKTVENLGIISLDLNGLKVNNDYLGHERGDYLLKKLATHIKVACEGIKEKHMARIGGDEFLILLPNSTSKTVETIEEKILVLSQNEDLLEKISVSVGTIFSDTKEESVYTLIQEADKKMYEMKSKTSKTYSEEIVSYVEKMEKFIR